MRDFPKEGFLVHHSRKERSSSRTSAEGHSASDAPAEASVYRLQTAYDLITSPAYVVIKAANEFKDKTTAIRERSSAGIRP